MFTIWPQRPAYNYQMGDFVMGLLLQYSNQIQATVLGIIRYYNLRLRMFAWDEGGLNQSDCS